MYPSARLSYCVLAPFHAALRGSPTHERKIKMETSMHDTHAFCFISRSYALYMKEIRGMCNAFIVYIEMEKNKIVAANV